MWASPLAVVILLGILALSAYADRIYFEMGKFLAREYTENIDAWEELVEPRLRLSRESASTSASVLRQIALAALAFLFAMRLHGPLMRSPAGLARTAFELLLVVLLFDRLLPQLFFTRTRGTWVARIAWLFQGLFYLVLPITLTLGLLLSIASLAEPEDTAEPEHPSEAMNALLEAGEEEGIFEESDRELVRSVVEFGDKVVREVMTPRPEMFAVPDTMSLEEFTAEVNSHSFSRVPVYAGTLDKITGIAFARDLLGVRDSDAGTQRVSRIQRAAAFIPESKKVNELLREMQREKQHMRIVIDEYGGVAGLVTIEDLIEAIVGNIEDEHDEPESDDAPVVEDDGTYLVSGSFDVSRLRELFSEQTQARADEDDRREAFDDDAASEASDQTLPEMLTGYEATTVGGLVSEIAGHIPLPGEVVEDGPLRLEVVASTDRLVERVRVGLSGGLTAGSSESE
ncbi:MAG: hemolysin family protein [Acidobacteriota bacterium]|nr:hemolysin family protein [Acidobacteriota bacterium]